MLVSVRRFCNTEMYGGECVKVCRRMWGGWEPAGGRGEEEEEVVMKEVE